MKIQITKNLITACCLVIPLTSFAAGVTSGGAVGGPPAITATNDQRIALLSINPNSLVANMRLAAGMTLDVQPYVSRTGGSGGVAGRYLLKATNVAVIMNDPVLARRVEYLISEMAAIQDKNKNGALYTSASEKKWLDNVRKGTIGKVSPSPWIATAENMNGLAVAASRLSDPEARTVLARNADWAVNTTKDLTILDWVKMAGGEHTGMATALLLASKVTGNSSFLKTADYFKKAAETDPAAFAREQLLASAHLLIS